MTYILIIVISTSYSSVATPVPGYKDKASCERAAAEVLAEKRDKVEAFCVSGPRRPV